MSATGRALAVAVLLGALPPRAAAEEGNDAPGRAGDTTTPARHGPLHLSATVLYEVFARQSGSEAGVSFDVVPVLSLGAGVALGRNVGPMVTADLHPVRNGKYRLLPFAQVRGSLFLLTPEGLAFGVGAWLGGSIEFGPGRFLLGAAGEIYLPTPEAHAPYALMGVVGYEVDLLRSPERVVEVREVGPGMSKEPATPAAPKIGRLVGRVFDRVSGSPLANAKVQLADTTASALLTDASGRFESLDMPVGPRRLTVSAPGYSDAHVVAVAAGPEATASEVPLDPAAKGTPSWISGLIRDDTGRPLRANVSVPSLRIQSAAGPDGKFQVEVPAGVHRLMVSKPGYLSQQKEIRIGTGTTVIFNFVLERAGGK